MAENALIPQQQADLTVVEVPLTAVLFPDGETGVVFPVFCAALDLEDGVQVHRLKKHPTLSAALVLAQVQTAGGPQVTNVLLSWGIPMWLGSLRIGSQPPEYRARIQALQREVCKAIAQLFHSDAPAPDQPEAPASRLRPAPEEAGAQRPAWERLLAALDETKQALVALRAEEQAERARLEQRLLEPTLSATHLNDLKAILRDLGQATRRAPALLEEELIILFKVETISAIPDALWPEVLAWYAWSATRA